MPPSKAVDGWLLPCIVTAAKIGRWESTVTSVHRGSTFALRRCALDFCLVGQILNCSREATGPPQCKWRLVYIRARCQAKIGQLEKVVRTFRQTSPMTESGLDCPICAKFARQRPGQRREILYLHGHSTPVWAERQARS